MNFVFSLLYSSVFLSFLFFYFSHLSSLFFSLSPFVLHHYVLVKVVFRGIRFGGFNSFYQKEFNMGVGDFGLTEAFIVCMQILKVNLYMLHKFNRDIHWNFKSKEKKKVSHIVEMLAELQFLFVIWSVFTLKMKMRCHHIIYNLVFFVILLKTMILKGEGLLCV